MAGATCATMNFGKYSVVNTIDRRLAQHISRRLAQHIRKTVEGHIQEADIDLAGRLMRLRIYKQIINNFLHDMVLHGNMLKYAIGDVSSNGEGRLCASIMIHPQYSQSAIDIRMAFDVLVNSVFYVIKIDDKWHTCTLHDIYKPGYMPSFAMIGDMPSMFTIYSQEEFEHSGTSIDDVRVTTSNIELKG